MEIKERKYAVVKHNTPDTMFLAERDVYYSYLGAHKLPEVNESDRFILFEYTINPDGTEVCTDAETFDDSNFLLSVAKSYDSYYDYLNLQYKTFNGELHFLKP
jgi:hypothetical protein